jgi:hypothetical protein
MAVILFSTFYWSIPFLKYQSNVAKGAPVEVEIYDKNAFLQNGIYAMSVFNITDKSVVYSDYTVAAKNVSEWAWRNVSFPFIIWGCQFGSVGTCRFSASGICINEISSIGLFFELAVVHNNLEIYHSSFGRFRMLRYRISFYVSGSFVIQKS